MTQLSDAMRVAKAVMLLKHSVKTIQFVLNLKVEMQEGVNSLKVVFTPLGDHGEER